MSKARETWSHEAGYIWSMIGSAVGFANILSFSALCYKNGGGAFLIPYLLAHLLVGIPMLILEGTIGQRTQLPLVTAMGQVAGPAGRLFGWLAVMTCATIGGFYIVLTGFSVAYTYFSASGLATVALLSETSSALTPSALFFKQHFLHDSGSLMQIGGVAPLVFGATLVVVAITWIVLARKIQSGVEKICSIFMPLLGILVLVFAITTCFLPGAAEGFKRYLIPDFARLSEWALWRDVFGQVFFSLSLGLGIVVGYSRHNKETFNIPRAMVSVALGDFFISFISGFAIFGGIGYLSMKSGIAFNELVTSDSAFEIGFVIFPMILSSFGPLLSKLIGSLFFFCVFIAGITGVFSIIESIAGNIEVEFQQSRKRAVALAMTASALLTLPFCLGNGQHILGALAPMVLGNAMLIGGVTAIFFFLYLSKVIRREPVWFKKAQVGVGPPRYPYYALRYFVLPMLLTSLCIAVYKELFNADWSPEVLVRWGWLAIALLSAFVFAMRKRTHALLAADQRPSLREKVKAEG